MIYCHTCGKISKCKIQNEWRLVCPKCGGSAKNTQELHKCFACGEYCKDGAIGANSLWYCEECFRNGSYQKYSEQDWQRMHKIRCDFLSLGYREDAAEILAYTLLQGNVDEALSAKHYKDKWPYNATSDDYRAYKACKYLGYTEEEALLQLKDRVIL